MALFDDFSTQDGTKWTFSSGATVSAGRLNLANPNTVTYIGATSVNTQDLTGYQASAQLVTVPNTVGSMETYIKVAQTANPGNNYLLFGLSGADFVAYSYAGGSGTAVWSQGSAPSAGTYARIRESAGTTFFDTSTDGRNWTQRGSITNPWSVTSVSFQILIGHFNSSENTTSTTAVWDNFNVTPVTATETGSGADAATVSTATPVSAADTGTGTEGLLLSRSVSDGGFGTDAVLMFAAPLSDVGTAASEATSIGAVTASADTGTGSDTAHLTVAITRADSGSLTEAAALTQFKSSGDSATAHEVTGIVASASAADVGTGADANSYLAVSTSGSDAATTVDVVTISGRGVFDTGSAVEGSSSVFGLVCVDSTNTADSLALHVGLVRGDGVGTTDSIALAPAPVIAELAGLDDGAVVVATYLRDAGTDTLDMPDTASPVASLQRPFPVESTGTRDSGISYVAGYGRSPSDALAITESLTFFVSSVFQDEAGLTEATVSTAAVDAPVEADSTGLTDSASSAWDYGRAAVEPVGLSDSVSFALALTVRDVATPAESLIAGKGYTLTLADTLSPSDGLAHAYGRALVDATGLSDAASGLRIPHVADTVSALEAATTTRVNFDFHRIGLMVDVHEDDPVMRVGVHRGS